MHSIWWGNGGKPNSAMTKRETHRQHPFRWQEWKLTAQSDQSHLHRGLNSAAFLALPLLAGIINDTVTMPSSSKITYTAKGKLSSSATGALSNTATVAVPSGVRDPNTNNNRATDIDTITFKADLKVTVTDGKTAAVRGQKDTYTITVSNLGLSNVAGAVVRDSFPATFIGVAFTSTQSGRRFRFTASGSGNINDTVTMPSGSKVTYKATGTISGSATGSISDTATVTSPNGVPDPNTTNNSAKDTDTL